MTLFPLPDERELTASTIHEDQSVHKIPCLLRLLRHQSPDSYKNGELDFILQLMRHLRLVGAHPRKTRSARSELGVSRMLLQPPDQREMIVHCLDLSFNFFLQSTCPSQKMIVSAEGFISFHPMPPTGSSASWRQRHSLHNS